MSRLWIQKISLGVLLVLAIPTVVWLRGLPPSRIAQFILAVSLVAVLAVLMWRARRASVGSSPARQMPRLHIVQRQVLGARTALALVEVDGSPYLVVHGEGFARTTPMRRPAKKSPARRRPVASLVRAGGMAS